MVDRVVGLATEVVGGGRLWLVMVFCYRFDSSGVWGWSYCRFVCSGMVVDGE